MWPDDQLKHLLMKADKSISWGSHCVWIIDPLQETAWTVTDGQVQWIKPGGTLQIEDTQIELKLLFGRANQFRKPVL